MSTFDGHIREFPDIQVDYFRRNAAARQPLACFLSHVHSDHLIGLETLRSPFVYCSAATRALVLRLERYPCRINFAQGILEARKRTYKSLKSLLKPLPLETPIVLELSPGNTLQVTLLDANHCPGSVMFLFESDRRAALYTGDTRCEPWFVNALVRSPCLAEYVSGLRAIDTVYLDTTYLDRDVVFQTKAEGLRELLQAVSRYPRETVFHFRAWTFGYEDVWMALSKVLRSKVHVDPYQMQLYQSLTAKTSTRRFAEQAHLSPEAPGLVGFMCANRPHDGCLVDSLDGQVENGSVRIHSCDKGTGCCAAVRDTPVVWIRPVVAHLSSDQDMAEAGAGGGGDDLSRDAEMEMLGPEDVHTVLQLMNGRALASEVQTVLPSIAGGLQGQRIVMLPVALYVDFPETDDQGEETAIKHINAAVRDWTRLSRSHPKHAEIPGGLPITITFPYARHSSYPELCHLLSELRPRDVWPCTVDPSKWFHRGNGERLTIRDLFGQYCSGDVFRHDVEVASTMSMGDVRTEVADSQATTEDLDGQDCTDRPPVHGYPFLYGSVDSGGQDAQDSQTSAVTEAARELRAQAHHAIVQNAIGGGEWLHIGLASTTDNHAEADVDLGCA